LEWIIGQFATLFFRMKRGFYVMVSIFIAAIWLGCGQYEEATYQELRQRMHDTFTGWQSTPDTLYEDEDVLLLPVGDSVTMIIGRIYDSLTVKVDTVHFENGRVYASGGDVYRLVYTDEDESLHIFLDSLDAAVFNGERK
jgi:hypothetical protein